MHFINWGKLAIDQLEPFLHDVYKCIHLFFTVSGSNIAGVHIKLIQDDACSKFHVDGYTYRLFTTYYGDATEYTSNENVRRSALGTTNKRIIKDFSKVKRMKNGDIAIMKGETPNFNKNNGIVHCSPSLAVAGDVRMILRIDHLG